MAAMERNITVEETELLSFFKQNIQWKLIVEASGPSGGAIFLFRGFAQPHVQPTGWHTTSWWVESMSLHIWGAT